MTSGTAIRLRPAPVHGVFGYFWPGWVLAGWGVLLGLDVWSVQSRRPITDDDIELELRAGR